MILKIVIKRTKLNKKQITFILTQTPTATMSIRKEALIKLDRELCVAEGKMKSAQSVLEDRHVKLSELAVSGPQFELHMQMAMVSGYAFAHCEYSAAYFKLRAKRHLQRAIDSGSENEEEFAAVAASGASLNKVVAQRLHCELDKQVAAVLAVVAEPRVVVESPPPSRVCSSPPNIKLKHDAAKRRRVSDDA